MADQQKHKAPKMMPSEKLISEPSHPFKKQKQQRSRLNMKEI